MKDTHGPNYTGFRVPPEIIAHAVWLSFRFNLSLRDIEDLLAARGVVVTDETIRQWRRKFGQQYANRLRRRRAQPGAKWHRSLHAAAGAPPWMKMAVGCRPTWAAGAAVVWYLVR